MGLIGWWPLNGDTKDYSGNGRHLNYNNNGGKLVDISEGKIGRARRRNVVNDGADYFGTPSNIDLTDRSFTMCCWAYVTDVHSGTANGLVTNHSHSHNSGAGITVRNLSADDYRISCNTGNGSSRTFHTYHGTSNIKGKWSHLIVRFDKSLNHLSLWVNGVQEYSMTYSMFCRPDRLDIFNWSTTHQNSASYRPAAAINDARVYDHALSEKEIKELAKAKVLHYKFDDFQEPTVNILKDTAYENRNYGQTYNATSWGDSGAHVIYYENNGYQSLPCMKMVKTAGGSGGSYHDNHGTFVLEDGKTYAVSVWVKASRPLPVNSYFFCLNRSDNAYRLGSGITIPTEWTHYSYNYTPGSGEGGNYKIRSILYTNEDLPVEVFWSQPQVEEKPHATPFTPSIREGTILDCSGYENHAELALATTPKWTEESKLGSGAYEFSLEQQIISNGLSFLSNVDGIENPISISLWANGKSSVGAYDGIFNVCDSNDGYSGLTCNITSDTAKRIRYWQDGGTTRAWSSPQSIGHWNHVVVVLSNNRTIVYENGEEVRNDAFTNPFSFGHRIHWGLYLYATSWYDGYLDDIRIYATALSDEDVLELYQTRASLDDGGNLNINNGIIETKHKPLIMDYTIWEDGQTGTIGSFGQYSSNNQRVRGLDPWGNETILWQGISLEGSTAGTGIYHSAVPIDNTKTYRMSWWEKRVTNATATYARYYAGLNGYGSVAGVGNLTNETPNTNPYFWNTSHTGLTEGEWFLVVGHVHPYTYTGATHSDSGRYNFQGKIGNIATDYRWLPETTTARSRTLMIYTPNAGGVIHQTAYPRMDICDGTEPSLQDLLNGFDSNHYDYVKAKGGKANIVMDMKDQETVFGEVSEIGPTNGLVAWYPLDGHADDIGGNGHHGTVNNIDFSVGMAGLSAHSSGSGYIDTLDLRNYNVFENELTVCMWYNPNTIINHIFMSTGQSRGNANHNARLYAGMRDNGQVDLGIQGSGWAGTPGTIPIAANSWSFIAIRMKQGIADLFINGEKEKTKTYTSYVLNSDLRILAHDNNYYHNSAAENVRIYNRALSDEEIGILYDMTRPDGPAMKQTDTTLYIKGEIKEV